MCLILHLQFPCAGKLIFFRLHFLDFFVRSLQILQGMNRSSSYQIDNAEWGFRDFKLFCPVSCSKWAVVLPARDEGDVRPFLQQLCKISNQMGFKLAEPKLFPVPQVGPNCQVLAWLGLVY